MTRRNTNQKKSKSKFFDKYDFYVNSVQSADHDASLIWRMFKDANDSRRMKNITIREDFCGTGALCFEWVKLGPSHRAVGVDIDASALSWGRRYYGARTNAEASSRVSLVCDDVMSYNLTKPDVICALNFSFYFMKDRCDLLRYFKRCRKDLRTNGLLVLDAFGGPAYLGAHSDRRRNSEKKFSFWWEVESFDAISHNIKTHLHFKPDGQKLRKRVFSYDWRLWTLPELTDVLRQAGFTKIEYWAEGLNSRGDGNGRFGKIKSEKNCETWVTYVTAR
jgi:SAM-dependent methyltransferase